VQTGDIGPKFGFSSNDNGWAKFHNVRIPRRNMLMRFNEVTKAGEFRKKGDQRILYSVMLFTRFDIIMTAWYALARGLTIAIRYSAVRRQFANIDDQQIERKILDYQT